MILFLIAGVICLGVAIWLFLRSRTPSLEDTDVARRVSAFIDESMHWEARVPSALERLEAEAQPSSVTAFINWIGESVSSRAGVVHDEELRQQLMAAGLYRVSPRTVMGYRVLGAIGLPVIAGLLLQLVHHSLKLHLLSELVIIVIFAFVGWILPLSVLQRRARTRLAEIDRMLPDLIDLLVVIIEAGLSFNTGMRMCADQIGSPLREELRLTLQEQTMGLSMEEALGHMVQRSDTSAMRAFTRAIAQSERSGISIAQVMQSLAHDMRHQRRAYAEEQAQKTPVKMLFPLVFLVFPAMFIVLLTPAMINLIHNISHA